MAILTARVSTLRRAGLPAKAGEPAHATLNIAVWQGERCAPLRPPAFCADVAASGGGRVRRPPDPADGARVTGRSTVMTAVRVVPEGHAAWQERAATGFGLERVPRSASFAVGQRLRPP